MANSYALVIVSRRALDLRDTAQAIPHAAPIPVSVRDEGSGTADALALTQGSVWPMTGLLVTQPTVVGRSPWYELLVSKRK